jgi:hypothetical protein
MQNKIYKIGRTLGLNKKDINSVLSSKSASAGYSTKEIYKSGTIYGTVNSKEIYKSGTIYGTVTPKEVYKSGNHYGTISPKDLL